MGFRYGVCTWIFGETSLEEVSQKLSKLGYDGVELFGDWERYPPRQTRRLLAEHGLSVFSLTPADVDLAHPESRIRKEALDYYFSLLDFASEVGSPMIACHGQVGRVRPMSTLEEEEGLFAEGVAKIAERAASAGLRVVLEVLNRYESHLLNTAAQARTFVEALDSPAVGILLDTYHMNVEEDDLSVAIRLAGEKLFLFHVADSNRRAVGRGHVPFPALFRTLAQIGYQGPVIVECTAPGPDPFTPAKGPGWREQVWEEVATSLQWLKLLQQLGVERR